MFKKVLYPYIFVGIVVVKLDTECVDRYLFKIECVHHRKLAPSTSKEKMSTCLNPSSSFYVRCTPCRHMDKRGDRWQ